MLTPTAKMGMFNKLVLAKLEKVFIGSNTANEVESGLNLSRVLRVLKRRYPRVGRNRKDQL